jgi:hypothetical protein
MKDNNDFKPVRLIGRLGVLLVSVLAMAWGIVEVEQGAYDIGFALISVAIWILLVAILLKY